MIEWSDPPAANKPIWWQLVEPVMQRPGCWALVRRYDSPGAASNAAYAIRAGDAVIPPGEWEARSGQITPDVPGWGVWVRWMGEE